MRTGLFKMTAILALTSHLYCAEQSSPFEKYVNEQSVTERFSNALVEMQKAKVKYFEDIKQLKKLPVELHNGCFKVYGLIKRLYHLPQPGEYVSIYKNGNLQSLLVKDIKVHSEYHLLGGLIVVCENGDMISLDMIVDIKGKYHNQFNQTAFLALYKDYI